MRRWKKVYLTLAVALAAGYFLVLPFCWPEPTVIATVPAEASLGEDLPVSVRVDAWHSNFEIAHVRFYVDFHGSTAHGPAGLFHPQPLHQGEGKASWTNRELSRLTLPVSKTLDLVFPLKRFAEQGKVGPGKLVGKVDVTFHFMEGFIPKRGKSGRHESISRTKYVPFEIELKEAEPEAPSENVPVERPGIL